MRLHRRVMRVWGVRQRNWGNPVPCLFGTRQDAEESRDPDEDLVLVRVEILRTIRTPDTTKRIRRAR